MNAVQQSYIDNPEKFKQIVWDYTMVPSEFFAILNNKSKKSDWLGQDWAIARVLECVSYYDAIALVPIETIKNRWEHISPKLFNKDIKKGYEYVLHKYAISTAR